MKAFLGLIIVIYLGISGTALAADAVTRYDLRLYSSPHFDADTTIDLKKRTPVTVIDRKGAWIHVETKNNRGWLRLHQIRLGDGKRKRKSGFTGLSYLLNVSQTGRSGARGITATTGIRGLDADELKNAKPDQAAVENLAAQAVSTDNANKFAKANGLKTVVVPHLVKESSNNFSKED